MKKIHLEPWGPFDKLCLISTMHKLKQTFGDQNWAAISRHTRQLYETISGLIEYDKRSDDWFSIKQCAAQYEALMKGTGTRKKKRGERNADNSDSLDLLEANLKQEFVEELQSSLQHMRKEYMKLKIIVEDIDNDKLDDEKLEELILESEDKGVVDIKSKLKLMLDERNNDNECTSKPSQPVPLVVSSDHQPLTSENKPCSTTSPLLTSLLQSPSPLRTSIPSTSSPTISILLHSSPPVPTTITDSKLSKLLETPTSLQTSSNNITATLAIPSSSGSQQSASGFKNVNEEKIILIEKIDNEKIEEARIIVEDMTDVEHDVVESEIIIEQQESPPAKKNVSRRLDLEVEDDETEEDVLETVEEIIERVEEAIIETVGENNLGDLDLTQSDDPITIDSDTCDIEEQLEIDQEQTVEVIVLDTTQGIVEDGTNILNNETVIIDGSPMKISEDTVIIDNSPVKISSNTVIIDDSSMKIGNDVLPVQISDETVVIDDSQMKINNEGVVPVKISNGTVVIDDSSMKIDTDAVILDDAPVILDNTPTNSLVNISNETIVIDDAPLKLCPDSIIFGNAEKSNNASAISNNAVKITDETVIISDSTSESDSDTIVLNQSPIKAANEPENNEIISIHNESEMSPQTAIEQCETNTPNDSAEKTVEKNHSFTITDEKQLPDPKDVVSTQSSIELRDSSCQTETVNAIVKCDGTPRNINLVQNESVQTEFIDVINKIDEQLCSDTSLIQSKSELPLIDENKSLKVKDSENIIPIIHSDVALNKYEDISSNNIGLEEAELKLNNISEDETVNKLSQINNDSDVKNIAENAQIENLDKTVITNQLKNQSSISSSPCQITEEDGKVVSGAHLDEELNNKNKSVEISNYKSSNSSNDNKNECDEICIESKEGQFQSITKGPSSVDDQRSSEMFDEFKEGLIEVQDKFTEKNENIEIKQLAEKSNDITEDKNNTEENMGCVEIIDNDGDDRDVADSLTNENEQERNENDSKEQVQEIKESMDNIEKEVDITEEDTLITENVPQKLEQVLSDPENLESLKNKENALIDEPIVDCKPTNTPAEKVDLDDDYNFHGFVLTSDSDDESSSSKYTITSDTLANESTITSDLDDKEQLSEITDAEESEYSSREMSPPSSPPRRGSLSALKDKEITFHSVVSRCYQEVKDRAADLVTSPKKKDKPSIQLIEKLPEKKTEIKPKKKPAPKKSKRRGGRKARVKEFDDSSSDSSLIRRIIEDERPDFSWKVPEVDFAGSGIMIRRTLDEALRPWRKSIMLVFNRLASHKFASVFSKPITEHEAPGYHDIVLRPMDLSTIKKNIDNGLIRSTVEFQRDMILMVQNAIIYNKYNTPYYEMAKEMGKDMLAEMEIMVQALGDGVPLLDDVGEEKQKPRARSSKPSNEESTRKRKNTASDEGRSAKRKRTSST